MHGSSRVLIIALDAAEPSLIERWINAGILPNLGRLRALGAYGRLASSAKWFAGSPWPTFYTASTPATHGIYHNVQWRADQMKTVMVGPDWLPITPFWRTLGSTDLRVIAIDLPMVYAPEPFSGIEIYGLVNRDLLGYKRASSSFPVELLQEIRNEFGITDNLTSNKRGIQRLSKLLQLRDELIHATHKIACLAEKYIKNDKWDLFLVNFMATHHGGHKLWDHSNCWDGANSSELSNALRDVYAACDHAVGQLTQAVGKDATILIFSLHGMGPNADCAHFLPEMVKRILSKETEYAKNKIGHQYTNPVQKLLKHIPVEVRVQASTSKAVLPLMKTYGLLHKKIHLRLKMLLVPSFSQQLICKATSE